MSATIRVLRSLAYVTGRELLRLNEPATSLETFARFAPPPITFTGFLSPFL